jgi:serine/threonine-protein kinase RsbW
MIGTSPASQGLCVRSTAEVPRAINHLLELMRVAGFAEKDLFGMRLALEEAIVNAIKHGNRSNPDKQVSIRYQLDEQQIVLEIEDEGSGFDPDGLPDPLSPENLERPGGRGVFLIRHYTTWMQYNEKGNRVTLCKKRSADAACRPT